MAKMRYKQLNFSGIVALALFGVICLIGVAGWTANERSQKTNIKFRTVSSTEQSTQQYLNVPQWGVEFPLSSTVSDAYYEVPMGMTNDPDGQPSAVVFGLTSLNGSCGTVSATPTGSSNSLGAIVRVPTAAIDPLSGESYTQLDPDGVTINGYYYGYADASIVGKTCAPTSTLQADSSAFASAVEGAIADTSSASE
jgi:hypothetical protein